MTTHSRRAVTVVNLVAVAVGVLLVACGVPDSGRFEALPANEVPAALRGTLPTSTTSSTTVPPTTSAPRFTTTTTTVPSESIQIFYVQGNRVEAVSVLEPTPVSPQRKMFDLAERIGMVSVSQRLASAIPADAALFATLGRGVVTVELGSSPASLLAEDQPLFFAQIVLTALAPSRQGQVIFTQYGRPYPAVKADRTVLMPGAPVAWEDYADLIIGDTQPPVPPVTEPAP